MNDVRIVRPLALTLTADALHSVDVYNAEMDSTISATIAGPLALRLETDKPKSIDRWVATWWGGAPSLVALIAQAEAPTVPVVVGAIQGRLF